MTRLLFMLLFGALALVGCRNLPEYTFTDAQIEQAIENYMGCDECADHQLYHVVILGEGAREFLEARKTNPLGGVPSTYSMELDARWVELEAKYGSDLKMDQRTYREVHMRAFENRVKARSAIALRAINRRWIPRSEVIGLVELER